MKNLLTIACLLLSLHLQAQNLISNYSFEELGWPDAPIPCPTSGGQITKSKDWMSAYGTPDYYNACSNGSYPAFGVPQNSVGHQEALTGNAYGLIACYSELFPNATEYLWHELDNPLVAGQSYRLSFHVSLADSVNFAISGIGALLSVENTREWSHYDFFNISQMIPSLTGPQVESSNLLVDKENWTEISGVFTANGGEKYLTIGSFNSDAEEDVQRVSNNESIIYNWEESGYYIDDVILEEYSDPAGISFLKTEAFEIYPNPNTTGLITVKHNLRGGELVVIDALGRRMTSLNPSFKGGEPIVIDVSAWPSGVYVVQVVDGSGNAGSAKLVRH